MWKHRAQLIKDQFLHALIISGCTSGAERLLKEAGEHTQSEDGGVAVIIAKRACVLYDASEVRQNPVPVEVTGDASPLAVSVAWARNRRALTIGVVNPTKQERELMIDLRGARFRRSGKLWRIAHSDPMAYNEPGEEPNVVIEEEPITGVSETLSLSPLSISLYRLRTRK